MHKITRFQKEYPKRLQEIIDPPALLYTLGKLPCDTKKTVGIVGARMCSQYGLSQAYYFARELSKYGVQIISGLAKGIDSAAHQGALDGGGETFGVLGCGVDICYPTSSKTLYEIMKKKGGILSEYEPGTKPLPYHFPKRNRIISGLSDIILVVEAKEKSGSFITVDQGLEQGKTVFAVPGRVQDKLSYGCNRLIAEGAFIAYKPEVILQELGIEPSRDNSSRLKIKLTKEQKLVYDRLELEGKSLHTLMEETKLPPSVLTRILFELVLNDSIIEPNKNYFAKKI